MAPNFMMVFLLRDCLMPDIEGAYIQGKTIANGTFRLYYEQQHHPRIKFSTNTVYVLNHDRFQNNLLTLSYADEGNAIVRDNTHPAARANIFTLSS